MINQIYRLVSPRQIEVTYKDYDLKDADVVVRPTHLSICAADQRYYTGTRGEEVLKRKLPMALIHEGAGIVVYDKIDKIPIGTKVVIVPNNPVEEDEYVGENYLPSSKFSSSGYDGFMQDNIIIDRNRLVKLPDDINMEVAAFTELITVAFHSIKRFEKKSIKRRGTFGIWGDGNLGFITALLLKKLYSDCHIILFGKTSYKMSQFSFVDSMYNISELPKNIEIDHGFECVGGSGSKAAVEQMIEHIKPEGTISLLGVSENPIEVDTRTILEKGLTLIGSSRSGVTDFREVVKIYEEIPEFVQYLNVLVGEVLDVANIKDMINAFELDVSNSWGKTIMKWNV